MNTLDKVHCELWIHCVLTTKNESPIIQPQFKEDLHQIINDEFFKMECSVKIINSSSTHLDCLFKLNPNLSILEIVDHIKRESSRFFKSKLDSSEEFDWQEDFSSLTVDATEIETVFDYIRDQDIRHLKEPFKSEFTQLLELHKINIE